MKLFPGVLALAVAAAFSAWAYPRLPERVVIHWGLDGAPDGWGSPLVAAVAMPAVGLGLAALFWLLPRFDGGRVAAGSNALAYFTLTNAILGFLAAAHGLIVAKWLGADFDLGRIGIAGASLLFILIGLLLPRMEPNRFMGIRMAWTLRSDAVWKKTHRAGGRVFVAAGVVMAGAALLPAPFHLFGAALAILPAVFIPIVLSCIYARKERA